MDRTDFSKARADMYRFLGGLYIMEVDSEQLSSLKEVEFPEIEGGEDSDLDLREGYGPVKDYIARVTEADLDNLAADYAKVFLAAGDATGRAAFPYESVYVDKRHQVGGSTQMQMHALYLERGFEPDPNVYRTMDDNIGLILEYMGILCDEITEALEGGDEAKALGIISEQAEVMRKHITNWIHPFTSDVVKYAETDFYKGVARITSGFIKKDAALLKEGGKAWGIE